MTRKLPTRIPSTTSSPAPSNDAPSRPSQSSSIPPQASPLSTDPSSYTEPFLTFLTENPTVFHAVSYFSKALTSHGYTQLSERCCWSTALEKGGKYFVERNGSSLVAFVVGEHYAPGNGAGIVAGHIDALTARLKPIPLLADTAGYVRLGVAPYAGGMNSTWWDRDLGIGGRVLVRDNTSGKIETRLVKLGWPIARIPTLAPHFGAASRGPFNLETQMVPIIGLSGDEGAETNGRAGEGARVRALGGEGAFTSTQPQRLVKAIAKELDIDDCEFAGYGVVHGSSANKCRRWLNCQLGTRALRHAACSAWWHG